ncbi:MAG: DUF4783 domain-containing protein [Prolixibacteraceae bacterium]|nr:DUF4783 domain-containing protein [Prolixibacteraceae bacterium]MBN2775091.1 DUF4783 domain-containing protein [Prolixibacteraceae bacterium]
MKIRIKKIFPLLLFSLFFLASYAQEEIPDKIILSLKSGDAKELSGFFNQNVELGILENDNVYSKAQAQQIVTKFFSDYQAEEFTIIHLQTGKNNVKSVIGRLVTNKGIFRVYFLLKVNQGKSYIHQLRIEKQA